MRVLISFLLAIALLAGLALVNRDQLFYELAKRSGGSPPPLLDAVEELPSTRWFDDYFTIDELAPGTYAIGETRYAQQNFNYLLVGSHTALLFDAGPGVRDLRPVVRSLTDLPLIFLPSHFHYDHVGNGIDFARRAVVDLPYLRDRSDGNELKLKELEHLGPVEGFAIPTWTVDHWWAPGQIVDLGDRLITVVHTPGHSPESISLYDVTNGLMLSGDYLYEGPLYAFVPGSSLEAYLATAERLLATYPEPMTYYGAHRSNPPGPPKLGQADLVALSDTLRAVREGTRDGEGLWPRTYRVNDRVTLLAPPAALQDWR